MSTKKKVMLLSLIMASICLMCGSKKHYEEILATLYQKVTVIAEITDIISKNHISGKTSDELIDSAIQGMLAPLDPHTVYYPPSSSNGYASLHYGYFGIGIEYSIIANYPVIINIVSGSPAAQTLKLGDVITSINNTQTASLSLQASEKLFEHNQKHVLLKIFRPSEEKYFATRLTKTHINFQSITDAFMIDASVGYIRIVRFNSDSDALLSLALDSLTLQGMKQLIIDLRDCPGGKLETAITIADIFLPPGKRIVDVINKDGTPTPYTSTANIKRYEDIPLVLLINAGSASAAELVASAIQENERGILIGSRTFGKSFIQSERVLRNKGILLVTTGEWKTALGRSLQRDAGSMKKSEYYKAARNNTYTLPDSSYISRRKTRSGKTLYEKNGITPDTIITDCRPDTSSVVNGFYRKYNAMFLRYVLNIAYEYQRQNITQKYYRYIALTANHLEEFKNLFKNPEEKKFIILYHNDIYRLLKREVVYFTAGEHARFLLNYQYDCQLQIAVQLVQSRALQTYFKK